MDHEKFSNALSVALASDNRLLRVMSPGIIPIIVSVVNGVIAELQGKEKQPLPGPKANPEDTVRAVTNVTYPKDMEGSPITPEDKMKKLQEAASPEPPKAAEPPPEPEPVKEFVNFFDMTKNDALNWYYENKDLYTLDVDGIDGMKAAELKKTLNELVNEAD